MPVMIIAGDRDVMFDSAKTTRRTALLANGSVTVLPGVGHAVPGQSEPVLRFLRLPVTAAPAAEGL